MVCLRGRRSHDIRVQMASMNHNLLLHEIPGSSVLRLVASYKHLGSRIEMDSRSCAESLARASSAMSAYCPLARKVFLDS